MQVPTHLLSARLEMRPWCEGDAAQLHPILVANRTHLGSWIPRGVSDPATPDELARRLGGFAAAFTSGREWRYALRIRSDGELVGEVGLYPRDATGRVAADAADRIEIGYWLRVDQTGRGLATEATMAMLDIVASVTGLRQVEIRCDRQNIPSAAIPRRLGFTPAEAHGEADDGMQLWTRAADAGASTVDRIS